MLGIAALFVPVSAAKALPISLVVPPGFEDMEGNSFHNPRNPYPDRVPGRPTPNGFRVQQLYPASGFSSLSPGPLLITAVAWRPDVSVNEPVCAEWDITALNLSTTTTTSLGSRYEGNYGSGGFTTVLSRVVQLETDGAPRPGGLPHDFDYVFEFQTPYVYDPQVGNLLLEVISASDLASARTWHDVTSLGASNRTAIGAPANSGVAMVLERGIPVTEFTIEPVATGLQAGDADMDLDFDQLDLVRVLQAGKYLTGEPATWGEGDWDGAPGGEPGNPPPGNGLFDQFDIMVALAGGHYMMGASAATAPFAYSVPVSSVPEPSAVVLGAIALGLLLTMRWRHLN